MTDTTKADEADQKNRLLQHGLHEETIFYNRLNFFLVFEGILLASLVSIDAKTNQFPQLSWLLPILGLVITAIWWYTQARKHRLVKLLGCRVEEELPEFKVTMALLTAAKRRGPSASALMTHAIPFFFVLFWIFLLVKR